MILFINTVVYLKLCCRGEKKKSATSEELISNKAVLYLKVKQYWCAIHNILSISTKIHLRAHNIASSIRNQ